MSTILKRNYAIELHFYIKSTVRCGVTVWVVID